MRSNREEKVRYLNDLLASYIAHVDAYNKKVVGLYDDEVELEKIKHNADAAHSMESCKNRFFSLKQVLHKEETDLEKEKQAIVELDKELYGKSLVDSPAFLRTRKI